MKKMILGELNSYFSEGKEMERSIDERRRFKRYPLHSGMVFVDNDNLIGMAKVIDISTCGVRCASLSKINCAIGMLENIDLFGTCEDMMLTGLSGWMTRCTDNMSYPEFYLNRNYYEFGFEFSPVHYSQITKMKMNLSTLKIACQPNCSELPLVV